MRSAAAVILSLLAATAQAHPGHGAVEGHLHGFSPEMILLAALVAVWAAIRSR